MNLSEYQESKLETLAFENGCAKHLVYYFGVRRDRDRLKALRPRISDADVLGRLACDVLATEDDPDGGAALLPHVAEQEDPWLFHTLAKALLSQGRFKDVLRLAQERAKQMRGDTNLLNLLAQWLVAQGQGALAAEVAQRSLALEPLQHDVEIYAELGKMGKPLPHSLYLEVWPQAATVTFYLPVYNVERYIRLAIEGLCALSHPLHEIIVVNDGTPDASMEIAREYPVRIIEHEGNRGLACARNTAFRNATTHFVGAIDTDAYPDPDFARNILLEFENTLPAVAGAGGRLIELNQKEPADRWRAKYLAQQQGAKRLCSPTGLFGSNTLFARDAILRVGGYDEQYRTNGEDVSLCHALRAMGYGFFYTPNAVAYHARVDTVASVLKTCWGWAEPGKRQAGYYEDPAVLVDSFNDLVKGTQAYIGHDLRADDPELGLIDVLCFFYVSFLDLNAAVKRGALAHGEARFVENTLIASLDSLEAVHGPGIRVRVEKHMAPLLHEPGNPPSQDLQQRAAHVVKQTEECYRAIPAEFYARMLQTDV